MLRLARTAATPASPTTPAVTGIARSVMYGRRPPCKRNLTFLRYDRVRSCIRPVAAAVMAAGHDVIRGSGPNQGAALFNRMALHGFSQSNGSTVSHHVVFTPAIRERYAHMVLFLYCQASFSFSPARHQSRRSRAGDLRHPVVLLLGEHRPCNARHLVGQRDRRDLCRLARQ
jgi:hypothetical protein